MYFYTVGSEEGGVSRLPLRLLHNGRRRLARFPGGQQVRQPPSPIHLHGDGLLRCGIVHS